MAPDVTTACSAFQWVGYLPADQTYPEAEGVVVLSPNALTSSRVGRSGTRS